MPRPRDLDATHSVQQPGQARRLERRRPGFIPPLLYAAAAAGADGFFLETHPDPARAPSDGPNMVPLDQLAGIVSLAVDVCTGYERPSVHKPQRAPASQPGGKQLVDRGKRSSRWRPRRPAPGRYARPGVRARHRDPRGGQRPGDRLGVGKSGLIARKIAATFTSTGTPAMFLHPVDSLHATSAS